MATEYEVVYATNFDKFRRVVNKYLEDGWECQGGAQHSSPQGLWVQALVKKKPATPKDEPAGATVKKVTKKRGPRKQPHVSS